MVRTSSYGGRCGRGRFLGCSLPGLRRGGRAWSSTMKHSREPAPLPTCLGRLPRGATAARLGTTLQAGRGAPAAPGGPRLGTHRAQARGPRVGDQLVAQLHVVTTEVLRSGSSATGGPSGALAAWQTSARMRVWTCVRCAVGVGLCREHAHAQ